MLPTFFILCRHLSRPLHLVYRIYALAVAEYSISDIPLRLAPESLVRHLAGRRHRGWETRDKQSQNFV